VAEFDEETAAYEPDEDWEEEPDPGGGILPLIDTEYFYDLLMEEQEQM
jgi:hypothetical protein